MLTEEAKPLWNKIMSYQADQRPNNHDCLRGLDQNAIEFCQYMFSAGVREATVKTYHKTKNGWRTS